MNKLDLNRLIQCEEYLYLGDASSKREDMKKRLHKRYLIWRYMYYFRCWQFYRDQRSDKSVSRFARKRAKYKSRYYEKKKNIYSYRAGVEIGVNS